MAQFIRAPSINETNLLLAILENHKGACSVDWDAVATQVGYKNAKVATTRFGEIKKKLGWAKGAGAGVMHGNGATIKKRGAPVRPRIQRGKSAGGGKGAKKQAQAQTKVEESDDDEEGVDDDADVHLQAPGQDEGQGQNVEYDAPEGAIRDWTIPSEDEDEDEDETFVSKVSRGVFDSPSHNGNHNSNDGEEEGNLSDTAEEKLNRQIREQ